MTARRRFNKIKEVLASKGCTNNWLCEQVSVNKTTASKWCTNKMQPTVETLFAIAEALEVDPGDLLVKLSDR